MSPPSLPERAIARKVLDEFCPADSDLDAFILDYFPDRRPSPGMDRPAKLNRLLEAHTPADVLIALRDRVGFDQSSQERLSALLGPGGSQAAGAGLERSSLGIPEHVPSQTSQRRSAFPLPRSVDLVRRACARVMVGNTARGTAYLIAPHLAITCRDVVALSSPGSMLTLRFPHGDISARVESVSNQDNNYAVLRLDSPVHHVEPLRRLNSWGENEVWLAVGFPKIAGDIGVMIEGTLRPLDGGEGNGPIHLLSADIPSNADLSGFEGSPVLIRGGVIGHLSDISAKVRTQTSPEGGVTVLRATSLQCVPEVANLPAPASRLIQPPSATYDPMWYVHREREERPALSHMAWPGATAVIWGPQRFGRTTLIKYLLHRCLQQDLLQGKRSRALEINLERLDDSAWQSFDLFLLNLSRTIAVGLGLDENEINSYWSRSTTPRDKLGLWMERRVLQETGGRLLLAIDQADAPWRRKLFHDSFFGMLRGWAEDTSEIWSRLRLIIAVETVPTLLISSTTQSPFNNTHIINLGDLRLPHVRQLAGLYGLKWTDSDLTELMSYVGGHPYLLRLAMFKGAVREHEQEPIARLLRSENEDDNVFAPHLDQLENQLQSQPELIEVLGQIVQERDIRISKETSLRLRSLGLIVEERGAYRIRYRIYEDLVRRLSSWRGR